MRPVTLDDGDALLRFFNELPEHDRSYLKDDLADPDVMQQWLSARGVRSLVVVDENGEVEALASFAVGVGRRDHVADLRVVVRADRRGTGLGTEIARAAVLQILRLGCRKITVEVGATQDATIRLFGGLGFVPEALLRDEVQTDSGGYDDLVLLAHFAEGTAE